ncbi:MAG: hypothetical protein H7061_07260 [Bdellovibrionaceae bacterium]|nr:hypothetical protein [Bdellovibrio sp.]
MKTEKEFSEFFVSHCAHESKQADFIVTISKTYWKDLTSHILGYFNYEERLAITEKAAQQLSLRCKNAVPTEAWPEVIRDFVNEQSWGFATTTKKPPYKETEQQKIFWTLFKFIWAFFQSMIILKTAVYYFGLEGGNHPDQTSGAWVWLFFSLSASSLIFFAYRNRHYQD